MYLKSIELSGFKSFAKKNIFEFNSPVSAIVGPNGSGKSNVAEAFRFVLGEQSIKSMRGKRGEDLIWNGASSEPRANRASVKVTFDNQNKLFDIDFPEVTIERTVHRDGLNEYFINGSLVRLKDILELLARAHIGASSHHVISQGEADQILNASAKDRQSMVLDALGLRLYQYKRLESERKLGKTSENIAQVEALRKEIAPHLKFLGKQVKRLEKTENLRGELLLLAQEYFKLEDDYLTSSKARLEAEKEPLNETLEKLSELESGLSAIEKEKDGLTREIGKLEGFIIAEEKAIEINTERSSTLELKTIKLKEVETLYHEISALSDAVAIKEKFGNFIKERKNNTDHKFTTEAEARIKEFKQRQAKFETSLEALKKKEHAISKLNLLKSNEGRINLIEAEFRRELNEVSHLVGPEVLKYKRKNMSSLRDDINRNDQEERKRNIQRLKIRLEDSSVSGMEEVHQEYKETAERDAFLARELLDLEKSAETLSELVKVLETRLAVEFKFGLENINKEFDRFFVAMFGGGDASLVLTKEAGKRSDLEEAEEVEVGLDIKVSLPRKKIRGLAMLSGGERALTSIALIFAISQVNPPPFIILDETDAALDESNSKKYGDLVEMLSKHSQLILITHNRETMSRAGIIYGVTMGSNSISKLLSISFDKATSFDEIAEAAK